eukprot:CAMPEP_0119401342 /NCGR_PEP_ID=MMETSP1334-20130426/142322_1 /TAXON_ID=127549 /ORGANISM="Calcidiscus leptoporus, Strain RCC1130" /LENGTH=204 /DNA_ID=CAMNT_0007425257 /DNA_START=255 /DNA_END=870 /DNA_ORIENTATION=+
MPHKPNGASAVASHCWPQPSRIAIAAASRLAPLDDNGRRAAAAVADASNAIPPVPLPQHVDQRDQDPRPTAANGVSQRHSAAIHVHLVGGQAEQLIVRDGDDGESFVDLKIVDLAQLQACVGHRPRDSSGGRCRKPGGRLLGVGVAFDSGEHRRADASALRRDMSTSAAAPSERVEAFAAVTVPPFLKAALAPPAADFCAVGAA